MSIRLALVLLALSATASADPDKTITNKGKTCQASVPASWKDGSTPGMASSPDSKLAVTLSQPKLVDSFDALKQAAKSAYKNSKVTKDTATELEMTGTSIAGKPDVYRAIASGTSFCVAEVTYEAGTMDVPLKIVRSLKPGS